MLDPQTRTIYLTALQPPDGFRLDRAIATTFSLDLLSLLIAPMSMTLLTEQDPAALIADPLAALEGLRRAAGRVAVFCQAGRIAVPQVDSRLYSYLEPSVVEVQATGGGVFHPKVWILRFTAEDSADVRYRLLCLSRNLTFDRSWDTILTLDGDLHAHRQRNFGINRPLVTFVEFLPQLALQPVSPAIKKHITTIAAEIGRVKFSPPPEFERIVAFVPSGIPGHQRLRFPAEYNRLLVMSPFLSERFLPRLRDRGQNNVFISRQESLDTLSPHKISSLANTTVYVMQPDAERPEFGSSDENGTHLPTEDLSGLHAKLYIAESGWYADLLTGSANASHPAFSGKNIEFMVHLRGKRSRVGIDKFLGSEDDDLSLQNMLMRYDPPAAPPADTAIARTLERQLNDGRQTLATAGLRLSITARNNRTFDVTLATDAPVELPPTLSGRCLPVSLDFGHARDIAPLCGGDTVIFEGLSLTGLTAFTVFELSATIEQKTASVRFVLNLPVDGMPSERDGHILRDISADKRRFVRYLLFLLADSADVSQMATLFANGRNGKNNAVATEVAGLPLLESLVRTLSRHPEKLARIAELVDSLQQTQDGQDVLPEGFIEIWQAFLEVRKMETER